MTSTLTDEQVSHIAQRYLEHIWAEELKKEGGTEKTLKTIKKNMLDVAERLGYSPEAIDQAFGVLASNALAEYADKS